MLASNYVEPADSTVKNGVVGIAKIAGDMFQGALGLLRMNPGEDDQHLDSGSKRPGELKLSGPKKTLRVFCGHNDESASNAACSTAF